MKTKPWLLLIFTFIVVAACFYMLEKSRQAHLSYLKKESAGSKPAKEITESINDFIFVESVSKYVFFTIAK